MSKIGLVQKTCFDLLVFNKDMLVRVVGLSEEEKEKEIKVRPRYKTDMCVPRELPIRIGFISSISYTHLELVVVNNGNVKHFTYTAEDADNGDIGIVPIDPMHSRLTEFFKSNYPEEENVEVGEDAEDKATRLLSRKVGVYCKVYQDADDNNAIAVSCYPFFIEGAETSTEAETILLNYVNTEYHKEEDEAVFTDISLMKHVTCLGVEEDGTTVWNR